MMTYQVLAFALAIVFVANISHIAGVAQVFNYNVTVKTSGSTKFTDHDGKLKLSVISTNGTKVSQADFVLTPNDVNLAMNRNYTSLIASFAPLNNITSVYLRWTLSSPYNPYYAIKKPSIFFDPIVFVYNYIDPRTHISSKLSRKFCPPTQPIGIKHSDGASFYPCV
ncbi:uncharacterized protein LOC107367476 [Tetranychus urticae]|uniref:Reelin domain-containing protein n=1 Tax=Tetranychus urticae TaxID=32264 RepID=T1KV57_TETUR|nr:uncharacterized protein LOC107367476 [Tetranychus urticae]